MYLNIWTAVTAVPVVALAMAIGLWHTSRQSDEATCRGCGLPEDECVCFGPALPL